MPSLFDPIRLGSITAANRVFMAPLTRGRATRLHVPTALMADYYAQRSTAGLIITEATGISPQGLGWPNAPGIWSEEQAAAWGRIVQAVHAQGGKIVVQLWHMGRLVHPDYLGGEAPVSASSTTAPGMAYTYEGKKLYARSRAMRLMEILSLIGDFRHAAANAMAAGFDGIQLHAANGYLIDQFMRDGTNHRTDSYGGTIKKRLRLLVEVTEALAQIAGPERTGVRLSPNDDPQGCSDSDSESLFVGAAAALNSLGIAFLEMRASRPESTYRPATRQLSPLIREAFKGTLVLNSDYRLRDATRAIQGGDADAISFGRPFLANPDLPKRLSTHAPLNEADVATYYSAGPAGYTDYPLFDDQARG